MISDNGPEFVNQLFREITEELGLEFKKETPPFHPASNGRIEGFHRFLKACISKHVSPRLEWDEVTSLATAAYNFFPNEHSKESPFFMMFGRDPIMPLNKLLQPKLRYVGNEEGILKLDTLQTIYKMVAMELDKARRKRDKELESIPKQFRVKVKVGDLVALKDHDAKVWQPKYKEAFRVVEFVGQTKIKVRNNLGKLLTVHVADAKPIELVDYIAQQLPDPTAFGAVRAINVQMDRMPDLNWQLPVHTYPFTTVVSGHSHLSAVTRVDSTTVTNTLTPNQCVSTSST